MRSFNQQHNLAQRQNDERLSKKWFVDTVICQAHGHMQFTENVIIPASFVEQDAFLAQQQTQGLKTHPIAQHVYFSGVDQMNELPHESREALENYLQYQLSVQNNLQQTFNPKPFP